MNLKMTKQNKLTFLITISGTVVLLDQISKVLIEKTFSLGQSIPIIGELFSLTYIRNPAGAFGIGIGGRAAHLILVSLIFIFLIIYYFRQKEGIMSNIALCFVLGGAFGNILDRIRFGEVVDFLDFDFPDIHIRAFRLFFLSFPDFSLQRWPVFNVADSFVTIGIFMLFLEIMKKKSKKN